MPIETRPEGMKPPPGRTVDGMFTVPDKAKPAPLLSYINILLRRRWLIIGGTFMLIMLVGVRCKLQAPIFTATAKFLPARTWEMSARMASIVGSGNQIDTAADNTSAEYYTALLNSPLFLERIFRRPFTIKNLGRNANLLSYFEIESGSDRERLQKGVEILLKMITVKTARGVPGKAAAIPIITLSVDSRDPQLSADIVNGILAEIITYNQNTSNFKAVQNRKFIEKQLKSAQDILNKAEADLAAFSGHNKMIVTPDLQAEKDRRQRTVKVQEEVFITLKKQLELAKIEEQEQQLSIEIIERALPPLKKSAPATLKNVILSAFLGLFFFAGLAFTLEYVKKIDPDERSAREFLEIMADIREDARKVGAWFGLGKGAQQDETPPAPQS